MFSFKTLKNIGSILSKILLSFVFLFMFSSASFSSDVPEWSGVYIKNSSGEYKELRKADDLRVSSHRSTFYYITSEFRLIPAKDFKGILIKGEENLKKYNIKPVRRTEKMSLSGLFGKNDKVDYDDIFATVANPSILSVLKSRNEAIDAKYFEPPEDAASFFGNAEKGKFVFISVGEKHNNKIYIFGITGVARTTLDKASHTVKDSHKGDTNHPSVNDSVVTDTDGQRKPIRANAQLSLKMCPPGYWFDMANKVCIVDDKK